VEVKTERIGDNLISSMIWLNRRSVTHPSAICSVYLGSDLRENGSNFGQTNNTKQIANGINSNIYGY
jgi:hypothetical protein